MEENQIEAIIAGVNKSLDQKIGEAFLHIDQRLEAHANASAAANEEHRRAIHGVRRNLITLWRHVRGPGSDPPADGSDEVPTIPQEGLAKLASQTDLEVDALRADMIEGFTKLEEKVETKHEEHSCEVQKLHAKQDAQTEMIKTLVGVAKHPLAKQLAIALVTAALTWLGVHASPPEHPQLPKTAEVSR